MTLVADILLGIGAIGAGLYCLVLSRRLRKLSQLENGMGGAIAVLSVQVDDMTKALERAQGAAGQSAGTLEALTLRAEDSARRLELLLASLHDLPEPAAPAEDAARRPRVLRRRVRSDLEMSQ